MVDHFALGIQVDHVILIVAKLTVLHMLYLLVNNYRADD